MIRTLFLVLSLTVPVSADVLFRNTRVFDGTRTLDQAAIFADGPQPGSFAFPVDEVSLR